MNSKVHNYKYAGIGSRDTPEDVLAEMTKIAIFLYEYGYCLRSGGATGADQAFEAGAKDDKEIYLPWDGFEGRYEDDKNFFIGTKAGRELAAQTVPHWYKLSQGSQKLHGRNTHQVLGLDLNVPVDFVVCWTPLGKKKGGTATAITLAEKYDIEVINLAIKQFPYHLFETEA